tara:strand:- start:4406 stop:5335 length:930 start_codon:yes stop_codon:yes gene_type:complete
MKILIKYFLLIFLFFFFGNTQIFSETKIVVKIDNKIISSYDIKNKINTNLKLRNLEINQSNIDKMKNLALQELINLRIKEKEILKYSSIDIESMDISKQLKSISSGNVEMLKKKFLDNNLDYDAFLHQLKVQAAWQNVIFYLFQNKVKIDENEINNELKNFKDEIFKLRELNLLELEANFGSSAERDSKIIQIKNSINEIGFEKSISIYSESETAVNGGRLGFINEKSLSKEILEKLKNLNEGDISEPIIRLNKIIFLKIDKIKISRNDNINIDEYKKNIIAKRKNDLFDLYSKSHLSKLKNNSYIEFK